MKLSPTTRERVLTAVSVLLLLGGALAIHFVSRRPGQDFDSYRLMAEAIVRGVDVYDPVVRAALSRELGFSSPAGMYYPPATGFTMALYALPPFQVAKSLWFFTMVGVVLFGVRALVRHAVPSAPSRLWMAAAGLVLMSSSLRWGLMLLQGAPMVLGLLGFFVVSLQKKDSPWPVAIALFATAFKLTLALPFVGLLLLHRRYAAIALSIAVPVLLNVLGFLRMGEGALAHYRHDVATLDTLSADNMNSPDPWLPYSLPRLDWIFLFYGLTKNLVLSRLATLAAAGGVALWLLREGLRVPKPSSYVTNAVFCAPLICLGSLVVYHHQYDIAPFFVPLLLGYFARDRLSRPTWAVITIVPLVAMMTFLPIGVTQSFIEPVFGMTGVVVLKLTFSVAVTLALVGSLAILRRHTASETDRATSASVVVAPPT